MKSFLRLLTFALFLLAGRVAAGETYADRELGEVEFMANHRTHDFNVGAGGEIWENEVVSSRFGVAALGVNKKDGLYGALYAGVRLNVPFVVSPFVGLSVAIGRGYDKDSEVRDNRNPSITFNGEDTRGPYTYIAACYPEAGVRLWLGRRAALVGSVRYFMSTTGRANDSFLYGGSLNVGY